MGKSPVLFSAGLILAATPFPELMVPRFAVSLASERGPDRPRSHSLGLVDGQ